MKNTFRLKATKEEIFDYFITVLLQDVLATTGKTVSISDLKPGFAYRKNISGNARKPRFAVVRLTEYQYPVHYAVEYTREDFRKKAVYDFLDNASGCQFIMTLNSEKQVWNDRGVREWQAVKQQSEEKKPSLMMRLRMAAVVRQLHRRRKTAVPQVLE